MTTKKLLKWQAYQIEFLAKFNFIISYILNKVNKKVDTFTYYLNNYLDNDYND